MIEEDGEDAIMDTSSGYDTCIGVKDVTAAPITLSKFFDDEEEEIVPDTEEKAWAALWKGMPKFEAVHMKPAKALLINFPTMEDYWAFAALFPEQSFTPKTKSVFYPFRTRNLIDHYRWIDEDAEQTIRDEEES